MLNYLMYFLMAVSLLSMLYAMYLVLGYDNSDHATRYLIICFVSILLFFPLLFVVYGDGTLQSEQKVKETIVSIKTVDNVENKVKVIPIINTKGDISAALSSDSKNVTKYTIKTKKHTYNINKEDLEITTDTSIKKSYILVTKGTYTRDTRWVLGDKKYTKVLKTELYLNK